MNFLGERAEKVAANFLVAQGYQVLDLNFSNKKGFRLGEIDLVAKDKTGELVFIEVKSAEKKNNLIIPEEKITPLKLAKINKIIFHYLKKKEWQEKEWRVDAISILVDKKSRKISIKQIKRIYF